MDPLIEEFCCAFAATIARRSSEPGVDVWPSPLINPFDINAATHTYILDNLAETLGEFNSPTAHLDADAATAHFRYPSRLCQLMYLFMEQPANAAVARNWEKTCRSTLQVIATLRSGDPFCRGGNILRGFEPDSVNESDCRLSAKVSSALVFRLSTLVELEYMALVAFGREIHGPYLTRSDRSMVVSDFHSLKPDHWEFTSQIPFQHLRVVQIFPKSRFRWDFVGRVFPASEQEPVAPICAYVEVDGISLNERATKGLCDDLDRTLTEGAAEVSKASISDLKRKWARSQLDASSGFSTKAAELRESDSIFLDKVGNSAAQSWIPAHLREISGQSFDMRSETLAGLLDPTRISKRDQLRASG